MRKTTIHASTGSATRTGGGFFDVPYIFLLLEFQSTVDTMMPVRFVRYITELYDSYQGKGGLGKLPAVFPILLYNGDAKWTAPVQFADCVESTVPAEYIPQFRYFPVIENEIPKESLSRIRNALSAVFYIENSSIAEIGDELDEFFNIIKDENLAIVNLLGSWFNNYLESLYAKVPGAGRRIPEAEIDRKFDSIMEVRTMFATRTREHDKIILNQGLERGLEQGIEQGLEQGELAEKQHVLIRLADRKFGISEANKQHILSVDDPDKLDSALDEIIFADSFEDVRAKLK